MSTAFMKQSEPFALTKEEVRLCSLVLLSIARAGDDIVAECMEATPPPGSVASQWFHARAAEKISRHVMDAFLSVEYAFLSASDHLRAMNTLVRSEPLRTAATVSLTRAGVEAYARSWRFLTAPSLEDLLHLHLSSRYSEYQYPERFGQTLLTYNGDQIDPSAERKFVLAEVSRLGLPKPTRINVTEVVAALLDAAHKNGEGRQTYSGLSAVAHAEKASLGNFLAFDRSRSRVTLQPSREILLGVVSTITLAAFEALEVLVEMFGAQRRHVAMLGATTEQAVDAMLTLLEADA